MTEKPNEPPAAEVMVKTVPAPQPSPPKDETAATPAPSPTATSAQPAAVPTFSRAFAGLPFGTWTGADGKKRFGMDWDYGLVKKKDAAPKAP